MTRSRLVRALVSQQQMGGDDIDRRTAQRLRRALDVQSTRLPAATEKRVRALTLLARTQRNLDDLKGAEKNLDAAALLLAKLASASELAADYHMTRGINQMSQGDITRAIDEMSRGTKADAPRAGFDRTGRSEFGAKHRRLRRCRGGRYADAGQCQQRRSATALRQCRGCRMCLARRANARKSRAQCRSAGSNAG